MTDTDNTMRTLRFHAYGESAAVLHMDRTDVPEAGANRIRIAVTAAGLAPADWALCRGLFAGELPRGIGIDVSGIVDAIGEGITDVAVGDRVLGSADWKSSPSAGASEFTMMDRWTLAPAGLDLTEAAAMPMAIDTAYWHLSALGLDPNRTILIHGAGTTIGFAAVQIALVRGMSVVGTAGETYAQRLRDLGATVVPYGDGMVERVRAANDGPIDAVLDTSPVAGALPDLIRIVDGDPSRVLTISDFAGAAQVGARSTLTEDFGERADALPEFAALAAQGRFSVPIARTFALEQWREALDISLAGQAHGKLLLLP